MNLYFNRNDLLLSHKEKEEENSMESDLCLIPPHETFQKQNFVPSHPMRSPVLNLSYRISSLESCTGTKFCTRNRTGSFFLNRDPNRTGIAIPGPEPDPNSSTRTRTRTGPDPIDTFKNMINFSNFYFIIIIKLFISLSLK